MKILVAEDDVLIRDGLCEILEAEGFDCSVAQDGEQALKVYEQDKPQLLLLDIMMPKQDGYSVCREVRKSDPHTAIIFISAKSEEIDRVVGLELGADDYIMKPFGKHEVLARIRAAFRRYNLTRQSDSSKASSKFMMGDLEVDPEQLRARRGDQRFELSVRDCKILALLHANQNKVVSRDQLFDACWGTRYLPSSRTLDQHISKLRKLIETDPKNPCLIKTVHGVGYRF